MNIIYLFEDFHFPGKYFPEIKKIRDQKKSAGKKNARNIGNVDIEPLIPNLVINTY